MTCKIPAHRVASRAAAAPWRKTAARTIVAGRPTDFAARAAVLLLSAAVLLLAAQMAYAKSTVVFWSNHRQEDEAAFLQLIDAFQRENPDIEIEWENQIDGEVDYYGKLTVAILGGVAPDVFYVRPGTDASFAQSGWTYDIDPLVQRDAVELRIEDFIPAQLGELMHRGKWWALPFDFSAIGLYYNQEMFDAAWLPYPSPGWTWDDVKEASRHLTRRAGDQTTQWALHGLNWYFSQWAEGFIMSFGGRLFDESYAESRANDPATVEALQLPVELVHEMQVAPRFDTPNYSALFRSGQAAMALDGSWATTTHRAFNPFRFDVSSLPAGPAGLTVSATGGGWAMSADTDVPEAAWKWMKFLASHEASRKLIVEPVRSLPPRISLMGEWAEQIVAQGAPQSALHLATQVVEHGRAIPQVGFSYAGILQAYRNQLVHGEISAREAAEQVHHAFQTELERLRQEEQ
mgnify:CR=1 FL=1